MLRREVTLPRQRLNGEGRPVGPLLLPGKGHAGDAAAAVGFRHVGGVEAAIGEAVLPQGEAGLPRPADGAVDLLQLHAGKLIELLEGQVGLLAGRQAEAALRGQHRVWVYGIVEVIQVKMELRPGGVGIVGLGDAGGLPAEEGSVLKLVEIKVICYKFICGLPLLRRCIAGKRRTFKIDSHTEDEIESVVEALNVLLSLGYVI